MKDIPLISVITPTLNSETTIEVCLKSVADQTYKKIEHLIIDGLSTDRTLEIITNYQTRYNHIRVVSEKDNGIYDAMNKGIDMAKGEWIYFLGSDDSLFDENVFSSLSMITRSYLYEIIYGNVILKTSGQKYDGKFSHFKLFEKNICHQSILTRKTVFDKIGRFDLKYKILADYHFNIKWFYNRIIKHFYTDQVIAYYDGRGISHNHKDQNFINDRNLIESKYIPLIIRKAFQYRNKKGFQKIIKFIWGE